MAKDHAPVLLWFRQDLRLADNPALQAALATGRPVVACFVLDRALGGRWAIGAASRWWLHFSLSALARSLAERGAPLILRQGGWREAIPALVRETGAAEVHAGRVYAPWEREADKAVADALAAEGVPITGHLSLLLHEPWSIRTQAGGSYGVYSPFSRAVFAADPPPDALPAPHSIPAPASVPRSDRLEDWRLLPTKPDWAGGMRQAWQPGESGAEARVAPFIGTALGQYGAVRNIPGIEGTSKLSPHLHFGEVSTRSLWARAGAAMAAKGKARDNAMTYLKEILWREFSYHLLWHRPEMPDEPLRQQFGNFPWREDDAGLSAWQRGQTGYPIVDAGMRELWHTGWMHNRVRMVTASFLIKHLLLPWQAGEAWFWDTLVDADAASNSASWQWVAGCGADAAPYFRIFNPVLQGEKFDTDGAYVRRWVPELARLPDSVLHKPWTAPALVLQEAGVRLGETYPMPIVEHEAARRRALAALASIGGLAA
jgi:deoxyribodipyrimidine photo-lyase